MYTVKEIAEAAIIAAAGTVVYAAVSNLIEGVLNAPKIKVEQKEVSEDELPDWIKEVLGK